MKVDSYWTESEVSSLLKVYSHNKTLSQIVSELQKIPGWTRSKDSIRHKIKRFCSAIAEQPLETIEEDISNPYSEVDRCWDLMFDIEAKYLSGIQRRSKGVLKNTSTKILSLSDIHFPFARVDLLEKIVKEHSDANIVVLNGDILEGYAFSRYEKHKKVAAIDEYLSAFDFIAYLSKNFPQVILVEGNHDVRVARTLKERGVPSELNQIVNPSVLARIANGEELNRDGSLKKKHEFSNVIFDSNESWYTKVGKTLFIHPYTRGSGKPGETAITMGDKLARRYEESEVDSVVCGHTHRIYKGVVNGRLYIEQGYLGGVLSHLFEPNNDYRNNYLNGYAVIYQDENGNTDFNKSQAVYLGECLPPKKAIVKGVK